MMTTWIAVAFFGSLVIASYLIYSAFLYLGLKWARVPEISIRRVILSIVIITIGQTVFFLSPWNDSSDLSFPAMIMVNAILVVVFPCLVISKLFKTGFVGTIQAFLMTLPGRVINIVLAMIVIQFLYEAFVTPSNNMAPTIVGNHVRDVCSECGAVNYGLTNDFLLICERCHVTQNFNIDQMIHSSDWFLVAKFLAPRRWDIVVFQTPEDPATIYGMRLVGLPGESVEIENGFVVVNGEKQTPPDSIRNVEYADEIPGMVGTKLWGADGPVKLGEDEYFVLGDFSQRARDSRMWEVGAPGHPPYAVPRSYIKGVVTHTYWPPDRWRIHR